MSFADEIKYEGKDGTLKQGVLYEFLKKGVVREYPCGEKRVGPYARNYYLEFSKVLSTGKTRDVIGAAAKKIAEIIAKFDKEKSVFSKALMAMKRSSSK